MRFAAVHAGNLVEKAALRQTFVLVLKLSQVSVIPPRLHFFKFIYPVALRPNAGHGLLIPEVS